MEPILLLQGFGWVKETCDFTQVMDRAAVVYRPVSPEREGSGTFALRRVATTGVQALALQRRARCAPSARKEVKLLQLDTFADAVFAHAQDCCKSTIL